MNPGIRGVPFVAAGSGVLAAGVGVTTSAPRRTSSPGPPHAHARTSVGLNCGIGVALENGWARLSQHLPQMDQWRRMPWRWRRLSAHVPLMLIAVVVIIVIIPLALGFYLRVTPPVERAQGSPSLASLCSAASLETVMVASSDPHSTPHCLGT